MAWVGWMLYSISGTETMFWMILGVIEGQIRGGYFPDCILDPSVVDPNVESGK